MLDLSKTTKESEEVYYTEEKVISLGKRDITLLIELAKANSRRRVRLCCHSSLDDTLHEMVIVHERNTYVRPHKHLNKTESMTVLLGEADYVTFSQDGEITEVLTLGDPRSEHTFFQTIRDERFHTLLVRSDWLAFVETTKGPFKKEDNVDAKWSPPSKKEKEVQSFLKSLIKEVDKYKLNT